MSTVVAVAVLMLCRRTVGFVAPPPPRPSVGGRASPIDVVGDYLEELAAPPVAEAATVAPKGVVITGGANGVGYAYAEEFVRLGHRVMICDIREPTEAVASLASKYEGASISGERCDVSEAASVRAFADKARGTLGSIDLWVNNAAINGGRRPFLEVPDETIEAVVRVNLFGVLICTKVAMEAMMAQATGGHILNTVGSGVRGGGTPGYVTYGAAKRGLPQMTDSLVAELDGKTQGYSWPPKPTKVKVHTLSPGMVFTDLLLKDSTPELRKFPFSVLAATPEDVAKDLVPKILTLTKNDNAKSGQFVEYLSTQRTLSKFFNRFVRQQKSDIIDDNGNVIKQQGVDYNADGVRALY
mmetsp:Transcript_31455/g.101048  ORF Transcript_31455/g.101048 Transcript_31455/m.101048 type:complete len:355 (-) Transcript_31455:64-1128(-)